MTEYKESEVQPGDTQNEILTTLAGDKPFVFIVATIDRDGSIDLKVDTGGGIPDARTVRALLEKTLKALP